ncbi:hypothetical protein, partial [Moorena sp. SIO3A5]
STSWKCLKSPFPFLFLKFRCAPPYFAVRLTLANLIRQGQAHRFYLKGDSSRFTRQLLIDGWVFKEEFPYPPSITTLWSIKLRVSFPVEPTVLQPVLYI